MHGVVRRVASEDTAQRLSNISNILGRITLHAGSIRCYASIFRIIHRVQPEECYHLAAESFVGFDVDSTFSTLDTNINGTHYLLSSIQEIVPNCKFYFAASSEMFGNASHSPQDENTPFHPRCSYGISKVTGYHLTENYRSQYGLFACSGILYNHESPRRSYSFVTRKIVSHAVRIKRGENIKLRLGNLDAQRDWGHAQDYIQAMWLMLQQNQPDDYVVASGKLHSVRDFVDVVFQRLDLCYQEYVLIDPQFFRQADKVPLVGNAQKVRSILGWNPTYTFDTLIDAMLEAEMESEFNKA